MKECIESPAERFADNSFCGSRVLREAGQSIYSFLGKAVSSMTRMPVAVLTSTQLFGKSCPIDWTAMAICGVRKNSFCWVDHRGCHSLRMVAKDGFGVRWGTGFEAVFSLKQMQPDVSIGSRCEKNQSTPLGWLCHDFCQGLGTAEPLAYPSARYWLFCGRTEKFLRLH